MIRHSLTFRWFTASRRAALRHSKILSRPIHTTPILHSDDNPTPSSSNPNRSSTDNSSSPIPQNGDPDKHDGYNISIFDDAVADILRDAKLKALRKKNRPPPDKLGDDSLPIDRYPWTRKIEEAGSPVPRKPRRRNSGEDSLPLSHKLKLGEDGLPIPSTWTRNKAKEGQPARDRRMAEDDTSIERRALDENGRLLFEGKTRQPNSAWELQEAGEDGLPVKRRVKLGEDGLPIKRKMLVKEGLPVKRPNAFKLDDGRPVERKADKRKLGEVGKDGLPIKSRSMRDDEDGQIIPTRRKLQARAPELDDDGQPITAHKKEKKLKNHSDYGSNFHPRDGIKKYLKWANTAQARASRPSQSASDRKRMNIISEEACDVILDRLEPSLQKHIGCDIIDINPGAGLWSSKLHDVLKPRTHILLEPDTKQFGQLLEPLLAAPDSTYKLVPKSGLAWKHLEAVLSRDYLPHQTAWERDDPRLEERNDTLLIVANLAYHPRKIYKGFPSLGQMVMYQLIGAIKAQTLVQKYGRARMLIWINDDERHHMIPKSLPQRRKPAMEADLVCEEITEVASSTLNSSDRDREQIVDIRSLQATLQRMENNGTKIPEGRESVLLQAHRGAAAQGNTSAENGQPIAIKASFKPREVVSQNYAHLISRYEDNFEILRSAWRLPESSPEKAAKLAEYKERREVWQKEVNESMGKSIHKQFLYNCESRLILSSSKPLLSWDRRQIEPIRLDAKEFFPPKPMSLIDIHPKRLHPVLRKNFPNNYDILEYFLTSFFVRPLQSVNEGLAHLIPGAHEWLVQECKTLKDPNKGGNPDLDELTVRCLTDEMFVEMVEAWARWPFRPTKVEILAAMGGATHDTGVGAAYGDMDFKLN